MIPPEDLKRIQKAVNVPQDGIWGPITRSALFARLNIVVPSEPPVWTISEKGIALIKQFEGIRIEAYKCPADVWTIGYGHTGPDVHPGLLITRARAEELLQADLIRFEEGVRKSAGECTQGQFDALVSFAFNLGLGALRNSTLLKMHKAGLYDKAAAEFGRWVFADGKRLTGLAKRRAAEAEMYLS